MLFILAVDLLHHMIELASEQVMPAPIGSQELHLCISLCADDAAIFINPACLNWTPSVTSSALLDRLLDWLQCYKKAPFLRFPGQLVFPLLLSRPKKLTKAHLQPIIDKTQARLPSWKGRLTLINSVLSSIPRYTLMVFLLSKWAKKQLGRICGSFLWMVCDNASGGQCHVSWKRCMHPSIWVDLASWTLKIQPRTSHTVALVRLD
jgi:hypothetical protein